MRKVNDQVCVSKNDVAASGERNRGAWLHDFLVGAEECLALFSQDTPYIEQVAGYSLDRSSGVR
jgi:hypothetical protein